MEILSARGKALAQDHVDWRNKAVIRINRFRDRSTFRLIVEGSLSGAWVDELEKCWREVRAAINGDQVRVDLSGVSYIDDKGRDLLKCMFSEGAELRATGVMTRGIIEEIAGEAD
jgi:ABC-type transporter Mla MlaB component